MTSGIRRQHKKYERPLRLFEKDRIEDENKFKEKYGLKNKKEIWKMKFAVKKIRNQAKGLIMSRPEEQDAFISRIVKKGLIKSGAKIDDILGMTIDKYVERRLQTLVLRKGFSTTAKGARQMITHRKIMIGDRIVNVPSYMINLEEEKIIKAVPARVKAKKEEAVGVENAAA